jgi:hypothetical protein
MREQLRDMEPAARGYVQPLVDEDTGRVTIPGKYAAICYDCPALLIRGPADAVDRGAADHAGRTVPMVAVEWDGDGRVVESVPWPSRWKGHDVRMVPWPLTDAEEALVSRAGR